MGGSSSSSSQQSTENRSEVNDSRVAVEQGGIGVGSGANVDVAITDGGIAKDLASASSDIAGAIGGGWDAIQNIGRGLSDATLKVIQENNKILADNKTDSAKDIAKTTITTITVTGVVLFIALLWFLSKRKR